jgi:hypothetical protein
MDVSMHLPHEEELKFVDYYLCGVVGALRLWRDFFFPRLAAAREWARDLERATRIIAARRERVQARRLAIFRKKLRPLIKENYRQRLAREIPDEWFWADKLACRWGFFVDPQKMKEWD